MERSFSECSATFCSSASPQVLHASELLLTADRIIQQMMHEGTAGATLLCGTELTQSAKQHKAGSRAEKVLRALEPTPEDLGLPAALTLLLKGITHNTYDDKVRNKAATTVSSSLRQHHERHRHLHMMNLVNVMIRVRSMHSMPVNCIRRGLENKYLGCPRHLWNMARSYREVPGEMWIDKALSAPALVSWAPPAGEPRSEHIDLCCRDNKEWWRSVKFSRHKDGQKVESELLHTVTGEHFYIPAALTDHLPDPGLGKDWPFLGKYDFSDAVVNLEEMEVYVAPVWKKILQLQNTNSMQLLMRPPPEADTKQWQGPTQIWHPPIILHCGTSSYVDNAKIVKNVRLNRKGTKSVIACDMQTFIRLWWLKAKLPEEYKDVVPWAGEFHGIAHYVDGIVILNWSYILEPILLHFDVKGFHLSLNMKETSQRIRWILLILCAGQQWMAAVFTEEEVKDIPKLLKKVEGNVAVWAFIGFLYYHAGMLWGFREAIQTSGHDMLDFLWKFSLRVYAHTNKNIYKKGCLQNSKVLQDSEERVQLLKKHHRTCNDTGRPCAGVALDYRNEKVPSHLTSRDVLTFLLSQTNAEFDRGINYPSDAQLRQFSSQLNVLRHNHRQKEEQHGVALYRKESVIDMREDIAMMVKHLNEKLGATRGECRRATTYSKMTETELRPNKVGWNVMLSKEEELRAWVKKVVDSGELGAVGDIAPDLAAELELTPEQLTALVALDDSDSGLGEVEVTGVDERALDVAPTPADGPADAAAEEAVSSPRTTSTEVAIVPSSPPGAELPTPLAESEESSSDDDVLLSMRYKSVSAASKAKKKSPAGESFIEYSLLLMLNCWQSPLQRHR